MNDKQSNQPKSPRQTPPDRKGSVESASTLSSSTGTPCRPLSDDKVDPCVHRVEAMAELTRLAAETPDVMARLIEQQRRGLAQMTEAARREQRRQDGDHPDVADDNAPDKNVADKNVPDDHVPANSNPAKSNPGADNQAAPKRTGRPRKFDVAARETVCLLMSVGLSRRQAAAYVACDPSTIAQTARRDELFKTELDRAIRMSQIAPLLSIVRASQTSWRAAAWLLKHNHPHRLLRRESELIKEREMVESVERMNDLLHKK